MSNGDLLRGTPLHGTPPHPPDGSRPRTRGLLPALVLIVLAPIGAEYLVGYDTTTGHPLALLWGLLIFGPLYGAPALLVRELAVRVGMRWTGILMMTAALGTIQAGVIDQSLFSLDYRDIGYWDQMVQPTLIVPLGFSAYNALTFIVGHQVWSFGVPIALTQGLWPSWASRPWLRAPGLVGASLLYVAGAGLVLDDTLKTESDHASPPQIAGALAVSAVLVALAFTRGRRTPRPRSLTPGTRVGLSRAWLLALLGLTAGLIVNLAPTTWVGVAVAVIALVTDALAVTWYSADPNWDRRHVVALATGAMVARAVTGFAAVPLGDVGPVAKYLHNVFFTLLSLALGGWAYHRNRVPPPAPC